MRRIALTIIVAILMLSTAAWAESGKEVFRSKCKPCALKPADKVSKQWERWVSSAKYSACCSGVTESDANMILEYLIKHAADSDQPEGDTFN